MTRVWTGSFAVPVFLTFLTTVLEFGREAYNHAVAPGITRHLHAPELDQVCRSRWRQQASASQPEPALNAFDLFYLNGSHTLRGPRTSGDRVNWGLLYIRQDRGYKPGVHVPQGVPLPISRGTFLYSRKKLLDIKTESIFIVLKILKFYLFGGLLLFYSAFLSKGILGVHAYLSNCWRVTWSEEGWEPQL